MADAEPTPSSSRHSKPSGRLEAQPRWKLGRWLRLRQREAERRWGSSAENLKHKRLWIKVFLLHVRYTCGYLAAGFLVSAPIQLGTHDQWDRIGKSLVLGVLCVLPFVVLWPFTRVDWGRMRLPEFKNLELAQTRWAVYLSAAFLFLCGLARLWPDGSMLWLFDLQIAWYSLLLMSFAWLRVKAHMVMFSEFYSIENDDDLVLSYRPPVRDQEVTVSLEGATPAAVKAPDSEPSEAEAAAAKPAAAEPSEAEAAAAKPAEEAEAPSEAAWRPDPAADEVTSAEPAVQVDPNAPAPTEPSNPEVLLREFEANADADAAPEAAAPPEAVREPT